MRTFCNSLLAALIIAALFWGNCFTCPQVVLAAKHGCCPKSNQPTAKCVTQVLQHFVKAEAASPAPPAVAQTPAIQPPAPVYESWAPVLTRSDHAPPDPLSLNSSFRI